MVRWPLWRKKLEGRPQGRLCWAGALLCLLLAATFSGAVRRQLRCRIRAQKEARCTARLQPSVIRPKACVRCCSRPAPSHTSKVPTRLRPAPPARRRRTSCRVHRLCLPSAGFPRHIASHACCGPMSWTRFGPASQRSGNQSPLNAPVLSAFCHFNSFPATAESLHAIPSPIQFCPRVADFQRTACSGHPWAENSLDEKGTKSQRMGSPKPHSKTKARGTPERATSSQPPIWRGWRAVHRSGTQSDDVVQPSRG